MPKRIYKKIKMNDERLSIVTAANTIVTTYAAQGYQLTLRQVFYQFVAKDLFPATWADPVSGTKNTQKNYKKLGDVLGDARMTGLMDWESMEDRTRELDSVSHWTTPASIIESASQEFRLNKWLDQKYRLEVYVEKDALEGIVRQAAHGLDVPIFSCRGYCSLSSLWEASQRLKKHVQDGQQPVILHLGDHDPSGLDMTRDIRERLNHFLHYDYMHDVVLPGMRVNGDDPNTVTPDHMRQAVEDDCGADGIVVRRIALTREQVDEYNPPPNPAKSTDARYADYAEEHGEESWELDALDPAVLDELITTTIDEYRDVGKYEDLEAKEERHRENLVKAAHHWDKGLSETVEKLKMTKKNRKGD